jgi:hypothetical protein
MRHSEAGPDPERHCQIPPALVHAQRHDSVGVIASRRGDVNDTPKIAVGGQSAQSDAGGHHHGPLAVAWEELGGVGRLIAGRCNEQGAQLHSLRDSRLQIPWALPPPVERHHNDPGRGCRG